MFPDENIVIVCVVRFHFGDVRYQSSFTVKEAGRFYDTSCQSIMSVTFTSAKSCVLCRLRCHDNVSAFDLPVVRSGHPVVWL